MVKRAVARRLLGVPVLLLVVTIAAFGMTLLLPGDPAVAAAGPNPTDEQVALARQVLHLDDAAPVRYVRWVGSAATGDFGTSVVTGRSITDELTRRLPITAGIGAVALVVAVLFGTLVGTFQAACAERWPDRLLLVLVTLGLSVPNFWLATMLVAYFSVKLHWFPAIGYTGFTESPSEWFRSIAMPVLTLAAFPAAEIARQIRTGLLGVIGNDYIRAAEARGLSRNRVIVKHALKNAAGPAVTIIGLRVGYLFAGSVIVERIFNIPGLGAYALEAIQNRDVPVIQAIVLVSAVIVIVASLLVDIAYTLLNPKVAVR